MFNEIIDKEDGFKDCIGFTTGNISLHSKYIYTLATHYIISPFCTCICICKLYFIIIAFSILFCVNQDIVI